MGLGQFNGQNLGTVEQVYYSGTLTLIVGQAVAFALDDTNNPTTIPAGALVVPPTSNVMERDLRGREVIDIASTNCQAVAGIVSDLGSMSGKAGPGWISIQKQSRGDICSIYTNASCTKNATILGVAASGGTNTVGSLSNASSGTFNFLNLAVALETLDRSSTNGLVLCEFV